MSDKIQQPTPEQHEALHKIIDRLPRWSEQFEDHSQCQETIASLRSMLDSQGRVSDQHHKRVQELAAENERLREIVKEAWRFWTETQDSWVRPELDRGYVLLRVRGDRYDAFDALFRASKDLDARSRTPRAAVEETDG